MFRRMILGSLLLLVLGAGSAWARSLEVEDFQATIEVRADGVVVVEERIDVRFTGSWNGIFRDIPYGYEYLGGVRGKIQLDLESVTDLASRPLQYWTKRRGGYLNVKIRVPKASDTTRTVVLRYSARNVIRKQEFADLEFGAQDELYWNVTGNEWAMPIHKASVEVRLPKGVPVDLIRARAYTGLLRERGEAYELTKGEDGTLRVRTTKTLHPGEGLTVVALFPPGHVAYPTFWQKVGWWFQANWYLLIPLTLLLLWILAWRAWGRDPMRHRTIIPDWEPPQGLRPAEVGVLVDDRLDQRDLTAAIVDLAVRGMITIHDSGDDDYRLELHRDRLPTSEREPYETKLIEGLFGDEDEVEMSDLKYKFVKGLKEVKESALDRLVGTGFFEKRPDKAMERWSGLTFLALIGLVVLGFVVRAPWPYWVTSLLCLIPMFVISRYMPRRTNKGLDALARIQGMEEYLVTAEKERMKALPMSHFETLLPFAIALGVHDRWAKAFKGLFREAPEWYRSRTSGFDSVLMGHSIGAMNRSVGSNLMSGPRASSKSSGWGGGGWSGGGGFSGGSSGGGFGGGGGGGW